jgi:hypothetical protein
MRTAALAALAAVAGLSSLAHGQATYSVTISGTSPTGFYNDWEGTHVCGLVPGAKPDGGGEVYRRIVGQGFGGVAGSSLVVTVIVAAGGTVTASVGYGDPGSPSALGVWRGAGGTLAHVKSAQGYDFSGVHVSASP